MDEFLPRAIEAVADTLSCASYLWSDSFSGIASTRPLFRSWSCVQRVTVPSHYLVRSVMETTTDLSTPMMRLA